MINNYKVIMNNTNKTNNTNINNNHGFSCINNIQYGFLIDGFNAIIVTYNTNIINIINFIVSSILFVLYIKDKICCMLI